MLAEDTWRSRHGEDEGVSSLDVATAFVVVLVGVVVVDKCHGIALVVLVGDETCHIEAAPVATAEGVVDGEFQSKVEGTALDYSVN